MRKIKNKKNKKTGHWWPGPAGQAAHRPLPLPLPLTLALSIGRSAGAAASSSGDHPDAAPAASTSPASVRRLDSPHPATLTASPPACRGRRRALCFCPRAPASAAARSRTRRSLTRTHSHVVARSLPRREDAGEKEKGSLAPATGNLGSLAACLNRDWRLRGLRKFQVYARSIYGVHFYRRLALTTACRNAFYRRWSMPTICRKPFLLAVGIDHRL